MVEKNNTHSLLIGYALWFFGFLGSHRFYFGKPITGIIWFFTLGLCGIGWVVDLFLIPAMDKAAERRYLEGPFNYNAAWLLLTYFGVLGLHRFYQHKWLSGILYLLTLGCFGLGIVYDFCTLNGQVDELNARG
jgi:TM2 domain-containing membrane protein YozV